MVGLELPPWVLAFALGALVSSSLIFGAVAGIYIALPHRWFSGLMAAGAGITIAAASLNLAVDSVQIIGALQTAVAFALGASAFSIANAWLSARHAKHRKRCGGCVQQPTERGAPGSGLSIALGTLIDGVPEAVVLGLETTRIGVPGLGLLAAFAVANFAESMSSSSGMQIAGRSKAYIFGLWGLSGLLIASLAGLSAALSGIAPRGIDAVCNAFAAGALIAVVVETIIPEATHDSPALNGLIAAFGFVVLLLLLNTA